MIIKRCSKPLGSFLLGLLFIMVASAAWAVPSIPGEVFDDFEDGDTSDWGFFGGNNAGGGGGPAGDRPKEGSYYLSTGWGGEGTASGFYGGAFKNLPNGSQVTLPADPWFNVWVFNQSDSTVDSYTLEITIREDTDGNGWTDGSEDSFRLSTTFTNPSFDDSWTLLSAPVSSFTNLGTGGDGTLVCSGDMLLQALVACAGVTLAAVATSLEIPLGDATLRAEGDLDFRGTLGVSKEAPVGFQAIRLYVDPDTTAAPEKVEKLLELTARYCVVLQTLRSAVEVTTARVSAG